MAILDDILVAMAAAIASQGAQAAMRPGQSSTSPIPAPPMDGAAKGMDFSQLVGQQTPSHLQKLQLDLS